MAEDVGVLKSITLRFRDYKNAQPKPDSTELRMQISELYAENENLKTDNAELQMQISELYAENRRLREKIAMLAGKISAISAALDIEKKINEVDENPYRESVATLERALEGATAKIKELDLKNKKLALQNKKRKKRKRSAVPPEQRDTRNIPVDLRKEVIDRDEGLCRYCGKHVGRRGQIDHVYPHSHGGVTSIENLVLSCQNCNMKKSDNVGMWPKPIDYLKTKHHV